MLELLTPAEMAQADAAAPDHGMPVAVLMERSGWAVARAARAFGPCRVMVLCGPGGNGGDGYVAARLLAGWGWPVSVAALAPPAPGSDAADAASRWGGPVGMFDPAAAARAGLVIDAVFGAGLSRDIGGLAAASLAAARRILAVDVPSGLDGLTGGMRGPVARAEATVTFVRAKPGHWLLPGRTLCGALTIADIGMPVAALPAAQTWSTGPALWRLPTLDATANKYSRGTVTVLGGVMPGAALLAADAARHGGAGLVTLACATVPPSAPPGLIVSAEPAETLLRDPRRGVWVCGPGLGQGAARQLLPLLLAAGRCVVADADALSGHAGNPAALRGAAVLTPHAGEFARLFGPPGTDRPASVRAAARQTGAVVLLKGADTIIASPDGRAAINATGTPALATAGSGDALSGLIAALLAGGMQPWEAACAGAWLHGRAGERLGFGLVAEALPAAIARVLAEVMAGLL